MANFESGVKDFVVGTATIQNLFPVDFKGNADISCVQCRYFSRNNGICQITKEITAYPQKHVGTYCPLEMEEAKNECNS